MNMAKAKQAPPRALGPAGRRLWRELTGGYEFDGADRAVLEEACATVDLIAAYKAILKRDGPMAESSQGVRAHPAAAELRQQRLVLVRLSRALKFPADEPKAPRRRSSSGRSALRSVGGVA